MQMKKEDLAESSVISHLYDLRELFYKMMLGLCDLPWTHALREVELPLPVEAENVLEYPRGPVEVELTGAQGERITEG